MGQLTNLAKVHLDGAFAKLHETLINWDPKKYSEADILTLREDLQAALVLYEESRTKMQKECREANEAKALLAKTTKVVAKLQSIINDPNTSEDVMAEATKNLPKQLVLLQAQMASVDKEGREAETATLLFDTYKEFVDLANQRLQDAKNVQQQVLDNLAQLDAEEAMAKQRREIAELRDSMGKASSATSSAMARVLEKRTAQVAAVKAMNDMTIPKPEVKSEFMKNLEAEVTGEPVKKSVDDLLAEAEAQLNKK